MPAPASLYSVTGILLSRRSSTPLSRSTWCCRALPPWNQRSRSARYSTNDSAHVHIYAQPGFVLGDRGIVLLLRIGIPSLDFPESERQRYDHGHKSRKPKQLSDSEPEAHGHQALVSTIRTVTTDDVPIESRNAFHSRCRFPATLALPIFQQVDCHRGDFSRRLSKASDADRSSN